MHKRDLRDAERVISGLTAAIFGILHIIRRAQQRRRVDELSERLSERHPTGTLPPHAMSIDRRLQARLTPRRP